MLIIQCKTIESKCKTVLKQRLKIIGPVTCTHSRWVVNRDIFLRINWIDVVERQAPFTFVARCGMQTALAHAVALGGVVGAR